MNRTYHTIVFLVLLLVVICATLTGCTPSKSKCSIEEILIDHKSFPSGTYFQPIISPAFDRPKDSFSQGFSFSPNEGGYIITNWHSPHTANRDYVRWLDAFETDKYRGPFETSDEIFKSTIADEYHVACGQVFGTYECRMAAQYSTYSIYFRVTISESGITMDDLNILLEAIEEKMASCS